MLDYEPPGTDKISASSNAKPEVRKFFDLLQNKRDQIRSRIQQKSSLSESFYSDLSEHLESHDWPSWKFDLETWQLAGIFKNQREEKSCKVNAKINLLQVSILKKDIGLVKLIVNLAKQKGQQVFDTLLHEEVYPFLDERWQLATHHKWILNASAIHLATFWHPESLVHLLKIKPELLNRPTGSIKTSNEQNNSQGSNRPNDFTPLHVASTLEGTSIPTSILIDKRANVEAKDIENKTPLHIAAKNGCLQKVMALLYDGNANVVAQDVIGETPLHQAKNSKIFDILLSKATTKQVLEIENNTQTPFFDKISLNHPSSLNTYLDKMVTSNDTDSDVHDQHLTFNLSMFNSITDDKQNYLDKHIALIKRGSEKMLRHPLMRLFISLKWQPHKIRYQINFFIFLVFVLIFSMHGIFCIDFLQCEDGKEGKLVKKLI